MTEVPTSGLTSAEARERLARYGGDVNAGDADCCVRRVHASHRTVLVWGYALAWFLFEDRVELAAFKYLESRRRRRPAASTASVLAEHGTGEEA